MFQFHSLVQWQLIKLRHPTSLSLTCSFLLKIGRNKGMSKKFKQISWDTPALVLMKIVTSFPMEKNPHFVYACLTHKLTAVCIITQLLGDATPVCVQQKTNDCSWKEVSLCLGPGSIAFLQDTMKHHLDPNIWLCQVMKMIQQVFYLRSLLFQNFTQHGMVVLYWCFGTVCWFHLQGSRILDCLTFDDGTNR